MEKPDKAFPSRDKEIKAVFPSFPAALTRMLTLQRMLTLGMLILECEYQAQNLLCMMEINHTN